MNALPKATDAMTPQEYARAICRESRSNFVYAFHFLKHRERRAMEAFYAFCMLVDSTVDCTARKETAKNMLMTWREEVERIYTGYPQHPVAQALAPHVKWANVPRDYLESLITGCEMDLEKNSYATFEELELYCYRVASCVGLTTLRLIGITPSATEEKGAIALGKALQLTNILRDIVNDFEMGRVYLPENELKQFGVSLDNLSAKWGGKNFEALMKFHIDRAKKLFTEGFGVFPLVQKEKRKWLAPLLIGRVYERLLYRIEEDPSLIFRQRLEIPATQKMGIVLKTFFELYIG